MQAMPQDPSRSPSRSLSITRSRAAPVPAIEPNTRDRPAARDGPDRKGVREPSGFRARALRRPSATGRAGTRPRPRTATCRRVLPARRLVAVRGRGGGFERGQRVGGGATGPGRAAGEHGGAVPAVEHGGGRILGGADADGRLRARREHQGQCGRGPAAGLAGYPGDLAAAAGPGDCKERRAARTGVLTDLQRFEQEQEELRRARTEAGPVQTA